MVPSRLALVEESKTEEAGAKLSEMNNTTAEVPLLALPNDPLWVIMEFLNEKDLAFFDVCCPLLYSTAQGEWIRREKRHGLNKKSTRVPHARARVLRWLRTANYAEVMENHAIIHGNRPSNRTSHFGFPKHQCSGCPSFPNHLDVNCFTNPQEYEFFIRISNRDWIAHEDNTSYSSCNGSTIPTSEPIAMGFVTDAYCEEENVKDDDDTKNSNNNNNGDESNTHCRISRLDLPCTIHSYAMERFLRCYHYNEENKCVYHKDYHDAFEEAIDRLSITVVGVRDSGAMSLVVSTNGFQNRIRSCPSHGVNIDFYDLTPKNIQSHCYDDLESKVTVSAQTFGAISDTSSGRLSGFQVYYQRCE